MVKDYTEEKNLKGKGLTKVLRKKYIPKLI